MLLPWRLRRLALASLFGYELDPTSYIGVSWVYPRGKLRLGPYARIGHGTVLRGLDDVELGAYSQIGTLNWLTGLSTHVPTPFFIGETHRCSSLRLGIHAAITTRHFVDCTNAVEIGAFSVISGVRSVLMTHGVDVRLGRQVSRGIAIGDFCYVGTGCTLLPGSKVASRSVIAAGALVRGELEHEGRVYAGVPARSVGDVPLDAPYFTRQHGVVE